MDTNTNIDQLIDTLEPVFNSSFADLCIKMDSMHLSADIQDYIVSELIEK